MNNLNKYIEELKEVYKANMPFVVFKRPNELKLSSYLSNTNDVISLANFEEEGFVFVPFKTGNKILFPLNKSIKKEINFKEEEIIIEEITNNALLKIKNEQQLKKNHLNLVQKTIDFIVDGKADKIVVSREEIVSVKEFHLFNSYKKMLQKYPNAFVYIWFHPKIGLWMGATPENLLSIKDNTFKTMALAGTQPYKNKMEVTWQTKEKKEQQFVTDYITNTINPLVKNITISDPFTVKAGNLLHISTEISGELFSKKALNSLIAALHPTPAVCGLPKNIATEFILENEHYDRSYYTGFLGELNVENKSDLYENKSDLYVNLRCMQLKKETIHIYIGGGITKESNAIKEWEETKNKALVIKNIL